MFLFYLAAAILGGGLILAAALGGLGGHGDVDHSAEVSTDVSQDVGSPEGIETAKDVGAAAGEFWLPFLSLRFWTYLLGGFGGFGVILSLANVGGEPLRIVSSAIVGLIAGLGAAYAARWMQTNETDSSVHSGDLLGVAAKVLVSSRNGEPAKVRMDVKGDLIDMLAVPLDGQSIEAGEEVVVVSVDGSRVTVAKAEDYLNS